MKLPLALLAVILIPAAGHAGRPYQGSELRPGDWYPVAPPSTAESPHGVPRAPHDYGYRARWRGYADQGLPDPDPYAGLYRKQPSAAPSSSYWEDPERSRWEENRWEGSGPYSYDESPFYDYDPVPGERPEQGRRGTWERQVPAGWSAGPAGAYVGTGYGYDMPAPNGYAAGTPIFGDLPYEPASEYRFRGDPAGAGVSPAAPVWHEGYRFRPLTAQEREKMRAGDRWRPPRRGRPPEPEPGTEWPGGGLPAEEAFGYEPDNNWFRRFYGERP